MARPKVTIGKSNAAERARAGGAVAADDEHLSTYSEERLARAIEEVKERGRAAALAEAEQRKSAAAAEAEERKIAAAEAEERARSAAAQADETKRAAAKADERARSAAATQDETKRAAAKFDERKRARVLEAQLDRDAREAATIILQAASRATEHAAATSPAAVAPVIWDEKQINNVTIADTSSKRFDDLATFVAAQLFNVSHEDSVGADHGQIMSGLDHQRPAPELGESSRGIITGVPAQQKPGKETVVAEPPAASDDAAKRRRRATAPRFMCTACGNSVRVTKLKQHPNLPVGVCLKSYQYIFSSLYTKDVALNGSCSTHENECRWCGDGGNMLLCDTCDKVFCKKCILRNFGISGLTVIEEITKWSCYYCDPTQLATLTRKLQTMEALNNNIGPHMPRKRRANTGEKGDSVARQPEEMQPNPEPVKKPRKSTKNDDQSP